MPTGNLGMVTLNQHMRKDQRHMADIGGTIRKWCPCLFIVVIWFWVPAPAAGADAVGYVESHKHGHINWARGKVQAIGVGVPSDKDSGTSPDANAKMLSIARNTAKQNLFDLLQSVGIDSHHQVLQRVDDNRQLLVKLKEMVYGAIELEDQRKYMTDGTVAVMVTFSLYGGFSQLMLPQEIKQIQPITQVSPNSTPPGISKTLNTADVNHTGLVVDARGIGLQPAMAPKILDEKGQEIYGATVISREFAVQNGVSRYFQKMDTAGTVPRIGNRPLIVKGLRTMAPANCDIVISNTDAEKLRRSSKHLSFLKQCRVVIVLSPQP